MEHSVPRKVKAILSGHDSHAIWKKQVEAEAESLPGVWRHFEGKATRWPDLEIKSDEKQDEWDVRLKKILESIDLAHAAEISQLVEPKEIWDYLNLKYEGENFQRLHQLTRDLLGIAQLKNMPVDAKVVRLQALNRSIAQQNPKLGLPEEWLLEILIVSMPDEYETELAIIKSSNAHLTLGYVHARLREKETMMQAPIEKLKALNIAKGRQAYHDKMDPSTCHGCWKKLSILEPGHCKAGYKQFAAINEGRDWRKSYWGYKAVKRYKERNKERDIISDDERKREGQSKVAKTRRYTARVDSSEDEASFSPYVQSCNQGQVTLFSSIPNTINRYQSSQPNMIISQISVPPICLPELIIMMPLNLYGHISVGWLIDSGASRHICNDKNMFIEIMSATDQIEVGNKEVMTASGKGDVRIPYDGISGQPSSIHLRDVLYIPCASENIISVGILDKRGVGFLISNGIMTISIKGKAIANAVLKNGVYYLQQKNSIPQAFPAKEISKSASKRLVSDADRMHCRLGHLGETRSQSFSKMVDDIEIQLKQCMCEAYILIKFTRKASKNCLPIATSKLECVDLDLYGLQDSFQLRFINLKKLFHKLLKTGVKLQKENVKFLEKVKTKKNHIDRGTEFLNDTIISWCNDEGIMLDPTVGYNPEANGIAERCNRTIMESLNTMRVKARLSEAYWEIATEASTYLHNRGLVSFLQNMTPWQAWYNNKPSAKRYKVWGCPAYVHIPQKKRKKLSRKAWKGIFVGYSRRHAGIYKIWDLEKKVVKEAKFVIFDELNSRCNYSDPPKEDHENFEAILKERDYKLDNWMTTIDENSSSDEKCIPFPANGLLRQERNSSDTLGIIPSSSAQNQLTIDSPSYHERTSESCGNSNREQDQNLLVTDEDNPSVFVPHSDNLSEVNPSSLSLQNSPLDIRLNARCKPESKTARMNRERAERISAKAAETEAANQKRREDEHAAGWRRVNPSPINRPWRINIPSTTVEALSSPYKLEWQNAIDNEVNSIRSDGTFSEPLDRPVNVKNSEIINAKFVFDIKYNEKGQLPLLFKARLVASRFTQVKGVNYEETFAPTMHLDAFRLILASAAAKGWKIRQLDVITAFLAGTLTELVYLRVPSELKHIFGNYVRVIKSIYGLKQAARVWFLLLQSFLNKIAFHSLPTDDSVMIMVNSTTGILVIIGIQ
ncbi:Copia protein [Golovinomyces cichoracearum]|uniref:Copia protein n=1 Tax=Golovinomyces cichoracearum TaxID=62708 RepID=A0A420J0M8_9PEZI|nr:Copia protein [Golovinomyces cichoracearum]